MSYKDSHITLFSDPTLIAVDYYSFFWPKLSAVEYLRLKSLVIHLSLCFLMRFNALSHLDMNEVKTKFDVWVLVIGQTCLDMIMWSFVITWPLVGGCSFAVVKLTIL